MKEMKKLELGGIRFFKWNQILCHDLNFIPSILVFHVHSSFGNFDPFHAWEIYIKDAVEFFTDLEFAKECLNLTTKDSGLFNDETITGFIDKVLTSLFACFKFDSNSFPNKGNQVPVIVIELCSSEAEPDNQVLFIDEPFYFAKLVDICSVLIDFLRDNEINSSKENNKENKFGFTHIQPMLKEKVLSDVNYEEDNICSICFEMYKSGDVIVLTPCSHKFHRDCVFKWMIIGDCCPLCRLDCKRKVDF
ncbi:protein goliath-like [Impatiens glandulifera]|uniref:protein goliath-like n=1 Tax=Impatiens glandulifera TaxID=253017 RepID=UPI001FB19411|nr:protein goliath-like [Impatiens glandulifera]